jgi:carbon monoxide dehydrogenase subunit G
MKINGSYVFPATADEVWDLLLDPQVLMQVIPGLQKVEVHGDDILATARIGVGLVKGVFSGKLTLLDKRKPVHVRVVGEGKGRPGHMSGECILDASEHDGQTTVNYQAEIKIGGPLATVGQRLVDAATQSIMQQGFGAFNRVLGERKAAAAARAAKDAAPRA